MIKRVLAACMALGLVGCASDHGGAPMLRPANAPPPPPPEVVGPDGFRPSEFAWSTAVGANSVVGSVTHKGKGGWSCAGQSAGLTPQTRYSTTRIRLLYGSSDQAVASVESVRAKNAANPGGDYSQFSRSTTCDSRNAFAFKGLPDGGYFLFVRVTPRKPTTTKDGGTVIMHRIEVHGGTVRQVVLP